jgi:hypothetical protein
MKKISWFRRLFHKHDWDKKSFLGSMILENMHGIKKHEEGSYILKTCKICGDERGFWVSFNQKVYPMSSTWIKLKLKERGL